MNTYLVRLTYDEELLYKYEGWITLTWVLEIEAYNEDDIGHRVIPALSKASKTFNFKYHTPKIISIEEI